MTNNSAKANRLRRSSPTGSIRADPNPIPISDFGRDGVTRLSWTTDGVERVEVHMDAPDGPLIMSGGSPAEVRTTTFRRNETAFCLQRVIGPITRSHGRHSCTSHETPTQ